MFTFGRFTIDEDARAAYLHLSVVRSVARTVEVEDGVNVDVDSTGAAVGVEISFSTMESLLETANILNDPATVEAIREAEAG